MATQIDHIMVGVLGPDAEISDFTEQMTDGRYQEPGLLFSIAIAPGALKDGRAGLLLCSERRTLTGPEVSIMKVSYADLGACMVAIMAQMTMLGILDRELGDPDFAAKINALRGCKPTLQ